MMNNEVRTFIAGRLSEKVQDKIYGFQRKLRHEFKDIRWIKKENLHLTLKFLGNIPANSINPVSEILDKTLDDFPIININLMDLGVFPDERRPRVLWIGLDGDIQRLGHIANLINRDVSVLGFPENRNHFSPHITIGRFKKKNYGRNIIDLVTNLGREINGSVLMDEIVLYESRLSSSGAAYYPLFKKRLKN